MNLTTVKLVKLKQYNTFRLHYYDLEGKRRRLSVGRDEHHALKMKVKFQGWLLEGKNPEKELNKESVKSKTVREFFPEFMERHGVLQSKGMQILYRQYMKNICRCQELIDCELAEVTKPMVLDYMHARKKLDGVENPTVNREAAFLKGLCSRAVEWGVIEKNNLLGIKLFAESPMRQVDTPLKDIQALLHALSPPLANITEFAVLTGFRKENILSLTIEQITFRMPEARDYVSLIVKGGRYEKFPLSFLASALLKRVIGNRTSGHVFLNPTTKKRYVSIHKSFDRVVRKLGLKVNDSKLTFHDLRHWFATYLHEFQGISLDSLRHLLSHRDRSTTDRYAWVSKFSLAEKLDRIPELQPDMEVARFGTVEENKGLPSLRQHA